MAANPSAAGRRPTECAEPAEQRPEGGEALKNSAATSAAAKQNGDQPGCGDGVMPEQEASERRRSVQGDARSFSSSPLPGQRPSFQIPRKTRERKGLYQFLPPDSREFEDLVKTVSSCYLDQASRGRFSYCKARLIHNELLEKEFIEKRREMKQEGRTDQEVAESFCFLFPDKSKLQWICEKGLTVGHSRITTLGNPSSGVYLSKYSDLLQINPFEAGSTGDMIVFKVMRGRLKHIHENMPKNAIEPSPKFDGHLSKSANRVTSLLSYRAFELTQQYFFEFAFDEIKARPRHVCPYAVVSFLYKRQEPAVSPMSVHRFNTPAPEGSKESNKRATARPSPLGTRYREVSMRELSDCVGSGCMQPYGDGRSSESSTVSCRSCAWTTAADSSGKSWYTVWSGPLVNKGQELFPICLRSSSRPYLPFKLPDKLEVSHGMQLEQVKRKIPSVLFSWDTYSASREVMKCGMSCSLFEVVDGKGKPTSGSLAALVNKLERDRMVLVKTLFDRGVLIILSSSQMVESKEKRGRLEKNLQALFIFQESRIVAKHSSRQCEPEPPSTDPHQASFSSLRAFVPALHYAMFKLRSNPGKDVSAGVERMATDYLTRIDSGAVRPFILPDYKHTMDDRPQAVPPPRPKFNMDSVLRTYVHNHSSYMLPLHKAKDIMERIRNPTPVPAPAPAATPQPVAPSVEYSPVSDWGATDLLDKRPPSEVPSVDGAKQKAGVAHSNGAESQLQTLIQQLPQQQQQQPSQKLRPSQNEYDKDKMKQLLKLIQLRKKTLVKEPGKERGEDGAWDSNNLKRKLEEDETGDGNKHHRTEALSNGEPSRGVLLDGAEEGTHGDNLTAVMESMGIYDTDLRARTHDNARTNASAVNETQRLLKILLATLNKAVHQGSLPTPSHQGEPSGPAALDSEPESRHRNELTSHTNYAEEDMDCSPGSPLSPGSPSEHVHPAVDSTWANSTSEGAAKTPNTGMLLTHKHISLPSPALNLANPEKAEPFPEPKLEPTLVPKPAQEPEPVSVPMPETVKEIHSELKTPTGLDVNMTVAPSLAQLEESPSRPSISLDTILNQEVYCLTSDIKSIMQTYHVAYASRHAPRLQPSSHDWSPNRCFSKFVASYVSPVATHSHVRALCETMQKLVPVVLLPVTSPPPQALATAPAASQPAAVRVEPPTAKSASQTSQDAGATLEVTPPRAKPVTAVVAVEPGGEIYSPSQPSAAEDASETSNPLNSSSSGHVPAGQEAGLLGGGLISQLKPEMFSSLVEIFKDVTKNTVKFYIYSSDDGEESEVCRLIKEYLKSLGNSECSPQTFLENSGNLDKLLIIIQNEDIAAHVHKIPALVSLKKLPSVNFAGVDSLDDVKNHTYNELFVSGGFIVSDEFVLNPDLITQERLQGLLQFLEEQSTPEHPWQWKVHCKSQKKLKELGRLSANAMGLLNLLSAYQKKHLVEFLPYHECDTQSRQAPDLECLIKLQAQHTQQRHLIFLTERPFEMFLQYSRNGIVIGSIDDIMTGFHSLIGSINQNELPTPPSTVNDECVDEEDMSLDSDDGEPPASGQSQKAEERKQKQPPPPKTEEFRPPLPEQQAAANNVSTLPDYGALKTAISQFKASNQMAAGTSDVGSLSPGGFPVNPHQSFLCPSTPWSSFTGSSSYTASPAYPASPCSSTHEQDYRPPTVTSPVVPSVPVRATPGPLANLVSQSLPLEVKPPPPPHLMMLGHTYGSDAGSSGSVGGSGPVGGSPLPSSSLPYVDHSDSAQPGFKPGGAPISASGAPATQPDRTQSGPGDCQWGSAGATTNDTAGSQSGVSSGPCNPSGLTASGGSTPVCQGGRTQLDCTDSFTAAPPTVASRGGSVLRPTLPPPPIGRFCNMGAIPGQMNHGPPPIRALGPGSLGAYRGRGLPPPVGPWPRPGRGHDRGAGTGGGACTWGFPGGGRGVPQDYYSDYSYSHGYAPE